MSEGVGTIKSGVRLLEVFGDPPVEFRPAPLWIWNGEVSQERITEMLEQFRAQGMGGVFVHPRPGLVTEYLSAQWFEMWGYALRECKRLGLGCHIYDENSFPSGFAGGHVMAENPLCAMKFITVKQYPTGTLPETESEGLAAYVVSEDGMWAERVARGAVRERNGRDGVYILDWDQDENRLWMAGFCQVDLVQPGTTDLFLRKTHAQYAERFGADFGAAVRYAFTDEPSLATHGLHASHYFLTEFRRDHGYSLEDHLDAFLVMNDTALGVRYDYFETLQRLWVRNFLRPMSNWCAAHGLEFTGHFNEHHWPNMAGQPNNMVSQRWMQAPGTDLLGFQFRPEDPKENGLYFLNLKECRSVANQLGRERVLCETTGGGGYGMEVEGFKRLTDYAMALGVNLVNPHLSHQTLAGARKYDWPQTLSDHSPWWSSYRMQADHEARVTLALMSGKEANRVLVLQPTGSAWMYSVPTQFQFGVASARAAAWRKVALESQSGLLRALYAGQVDFDLGDEWLMEEMGRVEAGKLRVGEGCYETVVVPPMMETIRPATLALLKQWVEAGGRVHFLGEGPNRIDGRRPGPGDRVLAEAIEGWTRHGSGESLVAAVRAEVVPRLSGPGGEPLPGELMWAWRCLEDGSQILFLANPWNGRLEGEVEVEGQWVTNLETFSGRLGSWPMRMEGGKLRLPFRVEPAKHFLWWIRPVAGSLRTEVREVPRWGVDLRQLSIEREEPNVCVIDYCDLELPTRRFVSVNTTRADLLSWQEHGFPHNPWNVSIQFKRVFLEYPFGDDSGFAVSYRFTVGELGEAKGGVELAFERPWLYRAWLNGREFSTKGGRRWWDENVRAFAVGDLIQAGENVLRLEVRPMHALAEIAPVYVLGDFSLVAQPVGFRLEPSRRLDLSDWKDLGMPFYVQGVSYRYAFQSDRAAQELLVNAGKWRGSALVVSVNGQELIRMSHPGAVCRIPCELGIGEHDLKVRLFGSLRNQLGPFHSNGLPGVWTWLQHPEKAPPGWDYQFVQTGIGAVPFISLA